MKITTIVQSTPQTPTATPSSPRTGRQRLALFSLVSLSVAFLIVLSVYAFLSWSLKPDIVRRSIEDRSEDVLGASIASSEFKFNIFPFPTGEMRNVTLSIKSPQGAVLQADKLKFHLRVSSLLLGRFEISSIEMVNGRTVIQLPEQSILSDLDITNIQMKVSSIRPRAPIRIRFRADYEKMPRSLNGELTLITDRLDKWELRSWSLKGDLELDELLIEKISAKARSGNSFRTRKGMVSAKLHFQKERTEPWIRSTGRADIKEFSYELKNEVSPFVSPVLNGGVMWDMAMNPESEEVSLKQASFELPFGRFELSGKFFPAIGELKQVRLGASAIALETIPQYYPAFKEAIPVNIGFSGKSNIEMALEGTLNHLSVHSRWDFTEALLAYGRFFSKGKGIPMDISADFLVRDHLMTDGDFSLQLKNAGIKGTLRKMDLRTGSGELNIITNKFTLSEWQSLLPFLGEFTAGGEVKLLANFSGNLVQGNPRNIKKMLNLTLDNGSYLRKDGSGLSRIDFMLDASDMAFELKKMQLQIGESPLFVEATVYNPYDKPSLKAELNSSRIFPIKVLSALQVFGEEYLPDAWKSLTEHFKRELALVFPESQALENFSLEMAQKDDKWTVEKMRFGLYQGTVQLRGDFNSSVSGDFTYHLDAEGEAIHLGNLFETWSPKEKMMDGKFFFTADLNGQGNSEDWRKTLSGEGLFSVTEGEFYGFDILGEIAGINGFSSLENLASGKTHFTDLRTKFSVQDGKITTPRLVLLAKDISVSGSGEISGAGLINYRIEAFLPAPLAARAFGEDLKPPVGDNSEMKFGPIPLLLSGSLNHPELEPDPSLLPDLQDKIQKKKAQKVFQNFPAEDFFFARRKNS